MNPYELLRRLIRDLNLQAQHDLQEIYRSAGGDPAAVEALLAEIIQSYGEAAAAVTADWYDELRADVGVRRGFTASIPEPSDPGASALVNWAVSTATDEAALVSLIEGGLQRRIMNYSRDVLTTNAVQDPRARGWMRTGSGECGFCAMLISRGSVYTKATVRFASHDHCHCSAAPAWAPDQIEDVKRLFVPSARRRSEETKAADADRARAWIAANL